MLAGVLAIDEITAGAVRCSTPTLRLEADLPALLTVPPGANRPRHIYGARAMDVYRRGEVVAWGLDDLGVTLEELEPLTRVAGRRFPPERTPGTRLEGSIDEAVESLVAGLRAKELI